LSDWVGLLKWGGEGYDALTIRSITHKDREELTLLDLVLQLHGEFRKNLEPIRVTLSKLA
jgi:hypothetical protein